MGFISWEEPRGRAPIQPADVSGAPEYSYEFSGEEVKVLQRLLKATAEERRVAFLHLGLQRSATLLAHFMTMALSVQANTRGFIESYLVIECNYTDRMAEEINLPTIEGALNGLTVAIAPVPKMCAGCAFRCGTMANQSAVTSEDAQLAVEDRRRFMCHEETDEEFNPLHVCAGWVEMQQQRKEEACQATRRSRSTGSRSTERVSGAASAAPFSSSTSASATRPASAKTTTNANAAAVSGKRPARRASSPSGDNAVGRAKTAQ
jgi:hypothetical protein